MSSIRRVLGIAAMASVASPLLAQEAEPLHTRNLNPLVSIFGLPAWDTVVRGSRLEATVEIANHYRRSTRGTDRAVLDGETDRTTLSFSHGLDGGWSVGAELPYYHVGGGFLDDTIDAWHSAFRLPDGGRNLRPEDQLMFRIGRGATDFFVLDHARSGIGDVQLKAAKTIGAEQQFVVQVTAKLPTGDATMLSGSGSTDAAITLLRSRPLLERTHPAGYYWGIGAVLAGKPDGILFEANRWVPTGIVGGSLRPWPKFGLKAQIDFHGAFFDTPLAEFGEAAALFTFAAWRPVGRNGTLDLAIVEDIRVSTAPDFGLRAAVKWHW